MISAKQRKILAFPYSDYEAIICDGAVRSGKTSVMTLAFIDWAMREFSGQRFGLCGKTVDSTVKNVVVPYISMRYAKKRYGIRWRRGDKVLEVRIGGAVNYFEVFGGKDESSFMLIQGRTLAGLLLDEVALMPRSFVMQAMARCSVDGARLWFSCNPESPSHWFYREWIERAEERNALYLHFTMEDNPGISERTRRQYKTRYSGVFYDRYVLGRWVVAEGLVYPMFGPACVVKDAPPGGRYYISCDYGTLNPFSAGLWCVTEKEAVRIREFYHDGRAASRQKTDEEYHRDLEELARGLPIEQVIVDPSAASFIETIRRHGRFSVRKAKNDVLDGIRFTASMLQGGFVKIGEDCKNAVREFGLYSWDVKEGGAELDRPQKINDHAMDDIRYFCYTILRREPFVADFMGGAGDDEAEEVAF